MHSARGGDRRRGIEPGGSENEALASAPTPNDHPGSLAWLDENFDQVDFVLPGSSRRLVEVRECAIPGAITAGLLLVSAVVVRRRRPY